MEFPVVTTDPILVDQLNRARRRPMFVEAGTEAFGKQGEEFSNYRVETYGVEVIYTAMPLERGPNGLPTKYLVTCAIYEPCNSCFPL